MKGILALATVAMLATVPEVWAAETGTTTNHTADSMTKGYHMMPGNKQNQMSNKDMPGFNPKCSDTALAKMPADHRAACRKNSTAMKND